MGSLDSGGGSGGEVGSLDSGGGAVGSLDSGGSGGEVGSLDSGGVVVLGVSPEGGAEDGVPGVAVVGADVGGVLPDVVGEGLVVEFPGVVPVLPSVDVVLPVVPAKEVVPVPPFEGGVVTFTVGIT